MRINWRELFACLPLPMLALAASYGVYSYALLFVPAWVAVAQAAAFELVYISLAVARLPEDQSQRRAWRISLGAVITSIIYNSLAGWFYQAPELLGNASLIAWLALASLHGAPLAWVAFLVSDLLLHRAPSDERDAPVVRHDAPVVSIQQVIGAPLAQIGVPQPEHDAPMLTDDAPTIEQRAIAFDRASLMVRSGVSIKRAAVECGVAESTLRRRLRGE